MTQEIPEEIVKEYIVAALRDAETPLERLAIMEAIESNVPPPIVTATREKAAEYAGSLLDEIVGDMTLKGRHRPTIVKEISQRNPSEEYKTISIWKAAINKEIRQALCSNNPVTGMKLANSRAMGVC